MAAANGSVCQKIRVPVSGAAPFLLMRKTVFLFVLSLATPTFGLQQRGQIQAPCDDGYALCMSGCATDRSPER